MQIKKERKQTYRYSYTQLVAIKPAKAPGQDSIGTGGQNSIGANTVDTLTLARNARTSPEMIDRFYAAPLQGEMNVGELQSKRRPRLWE